MKLKSLYLLLIAAIMLSACPQADASIKAGRWEKVCVNFFL